MVWKFSVAFCCVQAWYFCFIYWLVILLQSEIASDNAAYLLTETFKCFQFKNLHEVFHFRILIDILFSWQLSLQNSSQLQP